MESEEQGTTSEESEDTPHNLDGTQQLGGPQIGGGVGGLGGDAPGGTMTDQGRGYGAEGGAARQDAEGEQGAPQGLEGQERGGAEVGAGSGGLGGQEATDERREESSGQGDDADEESSEG